MKQKGYVMTMKMLIVLLVLITAFICLTACRHSRPSDGLNQASTAADQTPETTKAVVKSELPEGVTLEGLKYSQWGMHMYPYYSIRKTDEGYECSITVSEVYWPEIDGETAEYYDYDPETGYGYNHSAHDGDPFNPNGGKFSRVLITEEDMKSLCDDLLEQGILSMDGYNERWEPPFGMEVTDTGETFDLKLCFSDGRIVTAHGVDTKPDNFNNVYRVIRDFFEAHQDYSAYYPTEFPDEEISTLIVKFYDPYRFNNVPVYRIELHPSWENEWIIGLTDPYGEFLPKGTDISEYDRLGESGELPIDRFYEILKKYDLGSWNQTRKHDPNGEGHWNVTIYYKNGQEYNVDTNLEPDNYAAFREEMIHAIIEYYEEVKK